MQGGGLGTRLILMQKLPNCGTLYLWISFISVFWPTKQVSKVVMPQYPKIQGLLSPWSPYCINPPQPKVRRQASCRVTILGYPSRIWFILTIKDTVLQRYFSPILRVNNNPNRCRCVSSVQKHPPVCISEVIHFNFLLCIISPVKYIIDPVPCYIPCTVEKSAKKLFL